MINNDSTSDSSNLSSDSSSEQTVNKSLFNLSVQNYRYNIFMGRPSSSSHSFLKELHEEHTSSSVYKLVEAINLNIIYSMPFKGKKPFWDTVTPEIERLSTENLDALVLKLSEHVLQSETIDRLVDNVCIFLRAKVVKSSFKKTLLNNEDAVLFPVDALAILDDLNLFPNEIYTLSIRARLFHSIQLDLPTINIDKVDVPIIIKFYSSYLKRLCKLIFRDLNTIKLENLMNDSFDSIQKILKNSSSPKKRNLEQSADIPIEKISKIRKEYSK